MQQNKDSRNTHKKKSKERLNIVVSNINGNIKSNRKQKLENKNGKKTTEWILQATNRQDCTQKNVDMAKKEKPQERKWISFNSRTK